MYLVVRRHANKLLEFLVQDFLGHPVVVTGEDLVRVTPLRSTALDSEDKQVVADEPLLLYIRNLLRDWAMVFNTRDVPGSIGGHLCLCQVHTHTHVWTGECFAMTINTPRAIHTLQSSSVGSCRKPSAFGLFFFDGLLFLLSVNCVGV
jgi:hypothetical protein